MSNNTTLHVTATRPMSQPRVVSPLRVQRLDGKSSFPPTHNKKIKKSVHWLEFANVRCFERTSPVDAKDIWISPTDFAKSKAEVVQLAIDYATFVNIEEQNKQSIDSHLLSYSSSTSLSLIDYRGVECYTVARKRHKHLANECVIYAQREGMDDIETAELYARCNAWSRKVSLVQAIHDYMEIYDDIPRNENIMTPRNRALPNLPQVWSLVPPSKVPSTLKRKERSPVYTTEHKEEAESVPTRRLRRRISI